MTQRDAKGKKGKDDKRKLPPADDPDEAAGSDFNVVNLALWEGDLETAREILDTHAIVHRSKISPFEHTVLASFQRLHRQLVRRLNEYTVLAESAGLPEKLRDANPSLQSNGGHLLAIIWTQSDRDYEFRCYLLDLSWEQDFYESAAKLAAEASVADAPTRIARRGYGVGEAHLVADEEGDDEAANDIAWVATVGSMFLQTEVSDFCTCSVRGVWTAAEIPRPTTQFGSFRASSTALTL